MFTRVLARIDRRATNYLLDSLQRRGVIESGLNYRILAACQKGVFLYDRGRVTPVFPGDCFGMTSTGTPGEYYVAEYCLNGKQDERSHIYRCRWSGDRLHVVCQLSFTQGGARQWPARVHQIQWHEGFLWVCNTRQNVIWKCTEDGDVVAEWTGTSRFDYDFDNVTDLTNRVRHSPDYKHYNSIAFHQGLIYVLAHNSAGADKSGNSFVSVLDASLQEVKRHENVGKACHNLFFHGGDLYICDSANGSLLRNFEPVLQTGRFLRGLDAHGSVLLMGGSAHEVSAERRGESNSQLFFVDVKNHHLLHSFTLGRVGNIHDVLLLRD
jgi:hypothetical protein